MSRGSTRLDRSLIAVIAVFGVLLILSAILFGVGRSKKARAGPGGPAAADTRPLSVIPASDRSRPCRPCDPWPDTIAQVKTPKTSPTCCLPPQPPNPRPNPPGPAPEPRPKPQILIPPPTPLYSLFVYADGRVEPNAKFQLGDRRLTNLGFSVEYKGPPRASGSRIRVEWLVNGRLYYPFDFPPGDLSFTTPHPYRNLISEPGKFEVRLYVDGTQYDAVVFEVVAGPQQAAAARTGILDAVAAITRIKAQGPKSMPEPKVTTGEGPDAELIVTNATQFYLRYYVDGPVSKGVPVAPQGTARFRVPAGHYRCAAELVGAGFPALLREGEFVAANRYELVFKP